MLDLLKNGVFKNSIFSFEDIFLDLSYWKIQTSHITWISIRISIKVIIIPHNHYRQKCHSICDRKILFSCPSTYRCKMRYSIRKIIYANVTKPLENNSYVTDWSLPVLSSLILLFFYLSSRYSQRTLITQNRNK